MVLAVAFAGRCAGAQGSALVSDAIVLVQPNGPQTMLAVTYPYPVPHKQVKDRIADLARSAGWSVASLEVADQRIQTSASAGPQKSLGTQTGATAVLLNAPQTRAAGFLLQPYVDTFADARRIEIVYMVPPDQSFMGLRDFDDARISLRLVRMGGPYHYVVEYRGTGPIPRLPLTQAPAALKTSGAGHPIAGTSTAPKNAVGMVLALAAGAGIIAFVLVRVIARPRPGRRRTRTARRMAR